MRPPALPLPPRERGTRPAALPRGLAQRTQNGVRCAAIWKRSRALQAHCVRFHPHHLQVAAVEDPGLEVRAQTYCCRDEEAISASDADRQSKLSNSVATVLPGVLSLRAAQERLAENEVGEWYDRETYCCFPMNWFQETKVSSNCHRPALAPVHYNSCAIDEHLSSVSSSCGCMERSLE